jgi:hypothetical protein
MSIGSQNGQLIFENVSKVVYNGTSNLVIDTSLGRLGVSTDNPQSNLHVQGDALVTSNLVVNGEITTGGNVGINKSSPQYTLDVNGDIYSSGDITAFSDQRQKTAFEVIKNPLEKIEKVSGYTYEKTDDIGNRRTGVIAQEIKEILPEVVYGTDETSYSVAYGNMAGLFIEAIKALNEKIKILESKLISEPKQ